jgi:hypothetical protein
MVPGGGVSSQRQDREAIVFFLRLALLVALVATVVALGGPRHEVSGPSRPEAGVACQQDALLLPPGHPPVFGPPGRPDGRLALPPGHPPIDGPAGRWAPRAGPLEPAFEAPGSVDL